MHVNDDALRKRLRLV